MKTNKRSTRFLALLISALCSVGVTAEEEESEIEEVVVTANKRAESLSDISYSIQALDQEKLDNIGVKNVRDLINVVPGMSAQSTFSPTAGGTSLRAVRSIVGHDSAVGYYYDDAPVTYLGYGYTPNSDVFDIERVEVLKGPQGTLYGASSMGGAVRIITKDPDASGFGGSVQVSGYDTKGGEFSEGFDAALNIPIIEDVLAARVVYGERDVGGFIDDGSADAPLGDDVNPKDYDATRAKLKFTPNDRLTIEAMYWDAYSKDILGYTVESDDAEDLLILNQGGVKTTYESELEVISISGSYDFNSVTLEYAYSDSDVAAPLDFRQGGIIASGAGVTAQETHELRVLSNSDSAWQWIGGIYYRDAVRPFGLAVAFPFAPGGPSFSLPTDLTTLTSESIAFFGEVSYETGNWTFLIGGRQFNDDRTGQTRLDGLEASLNPDDPFALTGFNVGPFDLQVPGPYMIVDTDEEEFDEFSFKVNVKYEFDNGNMAYVNIAEGTRSGFLNFGALRNSVAGLGLDPDTFRIIEPDTVLSYELGSKGSIGDSLAYDVGVYYSEWEKMVQQLTSQDSNPLGILGNIGDSEFYGIEFAVTWYPDIEGLSLTARANLMDSDVDLRPDLDGTSFAESLVYGSQGNGKVSAISHENLNVSIDYITAVFNDLSLTLNGTAIYRGRQSDSLAKILRTNFQDGQVVPAESEDHTVVNVSARLDSERGWYATLFVRNLFNEVAFNAVHDARLFGVSRPRQLGLTLGFDF